MHCVAFYIGDMLICVFSDPILVKRLGMFCQMAHSNKEEEVLQKLLELLKSSQEMWQV